MVSWPPTACTNDVRNFVEFAESFEYVTWNMASVASLSFSARDVPEIWRSDSAGRGRDNEIDFHALGDPPERFSMRRFNRLYLTVSGEVHLVRLLVVYLRNSGGRQQDEQFVVTCASRDLLKR